MTRLFKAALALSIVGVAVTACQSEKTTPSAKESQAAAAPAVVVPMASNDPAPGQPAEPNSSGGEDAARPVMQAQVVLERLGFSPGIIDGKTGISTTNAVSGFQKANDLPVTGKLDDPTMQALARWSNITATRLVTIPQDFARGPFMALPDDPAKQAALPEMAYTSLDERLAERFHTTPEVLRGLNPQLQDAPFAADQQIRVPNIGGDRIDPNNVDNKGWLATLATLGVSDAQPDVARIVVSKSKGTLEAYDKADKLVAVFTVTTGSEKDPLPLGDWKINGKSYNPEFSYDASLFWDVPDSKGEHLLPPGPNGPVGVVWIDLSKEHYGIHGTPEPQTIGRAESHGCVRLTNWDAARLAQMVSGSTKVSFVR